MAWALWSSDAPPQDPWGVATTWNGRDPVLVDFAGGDAGVHTPLGASPVAPAQPAQVATFQPLFDLDFYNRLHLSITVMALGNVVGQQFRQVSVWNAFSYGVRLVDFDVLNGEGITVSGQSLPPLGFGPLQERTWTVAVSPDGPPTIDTTVLWSFDTGTQLRLSITGRRVTPWPWRPDWSKGITESLEWRTDVLESEEGDEQRIAMRMTPRQSWEFTSSPVGQERQAMEAAAIGWSGRTWALPLWPHGADLVNGAAFGATVLFIPTAGREFLEGGLAILLGGDALASEVVEVEEVLADRLVLKRPLARAWPAEATTVYPAKTAAMDAATTLGRFTGDSTDARVRFMVAQANPYPELDDLVQYRGHGVLEDRPDWSAEPTLVPDRKQAIVDNGVGVPLRTDRTGVPNLRQSFRWAPLGRAQVDRIRRLQYLLGGRRRALWVPSFASDLTLATLAPEGATNIDVEWVGYTAYLRGVIGRTDVRVETDAGVFYRRITGSTDLGTGRERLGLDAPLPYLVSPADPGGVRISYLTLWRGDSDRLEWAWWSGDMGADYVHADTPMPFRTFRHDV